jgi:hypothetical protein
MRRFIGRSLLGLVFWFLVSSVNVSTAKRVEAHPVQIQRCIILNRQYEEFGGCTMITLIVGCDCTPGLVPTCSTYDYCQTVVCDFGGPLTQQTICF